MDERDVTTLPATPDELDRELYHFVGITIDDKYKLVRGLGAGGHGAVYLGADRSTDPQTPVAVKTLRPEMKSDPTSLRRFLREAEVLQMFDHPNIVRCYGFGETPFPWMALEYADGPTLASVLDREQRFTPTRAARIVAQLLAALSHAHGKGIAHRDLKPSNIVFTHAHRNAQLKLLDFGVALRPPRSTKSVRITVSGQVVGTPLYIAPERIITDEAGDARSDVWSVGVLLYELVSGQRPFSGDTIWEQLGRMLNVPPSSMNALGITVDPAFQSLIDNALKPDPAKRFESAAAMLTAVNQWLESE